MALGSATSAEPQELPGRLEEQHRQQLDRVAQAEERQQRHGDQDAQRHAFVERHRVRVRKERPLLERESDNHEQVAGTHQVQLRQ